jgi:hypothetical protein
MAPAEECMDHMYLKGSSMICFQSDESNDSLSMGHNSWIDSAVETSSSIVEESYEYVESDHMHRKDSEEPNLV